MPPQQAYGLLDFIDHGLCFGAHRKVLALVLNVAIRLDGKSYPAIAARANAGSGRDHS
ncbi:MAG: hypothetical protein HPM95_13685 [Alphaproteobacteria bacterium]|nr:hypothetical protein [Alphaproteobacteria bacterium]